MSCIAVDNFGVAILVIVAVYLTTDYNVRLTHRSEGTIKDCIIAGFASLFASAVIGFVIFKSVYC